MNDDDEEQREPGEDYIECPHCGGDAVLCDLCALNGADCIDEEE